MEILVLGGAYLLGSVPSGYVLGRLSGVDVRTAGSGNVGATNVARVVGKRQGVLTLILDVAKGMIAVIIARWLDLPAAMVALTGIAAFLGHLYPVFLKFKGGKGVATALGVLLGLAPLATLALIVIFAGVIACTRIVSLGSMITAAAAPAVLWILSYAASLIMLAGFLATMIIWRHRANIKRLLAGTEPRFSSV